MRHADNNKLFSNKTRLPVDNLSGDEGKCLASTLPLKLRFPVFVQRFLNLGNSGQSGNVSVFHRTCVY